MDKISTTIGSDPSRSAWQVRFDEVAFGTPVNRAGLIVGFTLPWSADMPLFSRDNPLRETIHLSEFRRQLFEGWLAEAVAVGRTFVTDVRNEVHGTVIDDVSPKVPNRQACRFSNGFFARRNSPSRVHVTVRRSSSLNLEKYLS